MTVTEKYKLDLDSVRQNPNLLNNYLFAKDTKNSKHFERLRLNIGIYNDLKQSDFEIVKFLFTEEKEWRKYGKDGEVDNLYFSAFILTYFNNPEIIWLFFETKNSDFDSSIGFDGEYLVSAGIEATYKYLKTTQHPQRQNLLEYIGETVEECKYSQKDIDNWKEFKKKYFQCYKYPIQDIVYFLYSTNEKQLFLEQLPNWISTQSNWTYDKLGLYRTYAKFAENKVMQIEATKVSIEENDKDFLTDIYKRELAELYIDNSEYDKAFETLIEIIKGTDNKNIIRDCLEQLCRIIFADEAVSNPVIVNSYKTIKREQKKYKNFSPNVDSLIQEAEKMVDKKKLVNYNNTLPKATQIGFLMNLWNKFKGRNSNE